MQLLSSQKQNKNKEQTNKTALLSMREAEALSNHWPNCWLAEILSTAYPLLTLLLCRPSAQSRRTGRVWKKKKRIQIPRPDSTSGFPAQGWRSTRETRPVNCETGRLRFSQLAERFQWASVFRSQGGEAGDTCP